jgi:hypothetical protein
MRDQRGDARIGDVAGQQRGKMISDMWARSVAAL